MAFRKIYDGIRLVAKAVSSGGILGAFQALDPDSDGEGTVQVHNGDTYSDILTKDHVSDVSNKTLDNTNTLDGVTIIDPEFEAEKLTLKEIASPSNPAAGEHKLYVNENNSDLEIKDSSGNITKFVEQVSFTADVVYGTDNLENQTTIGYSASATSNKIIQRDSNASAKVDILSDSDMSAAGGDITNRNYVRRKVIVDSNDTTATEGGSLSISTNTNSNLYYINAGSDLNSYTITLPDLKGYVDYNKAYEYTFIFSTTINSLTISTQGGSSTNFFINHAEAGDAFSVVFDDDNNLWYLKDQYSRNLNNVQSEHIAVRLLDGTETTLPTGTVTVDGQSVIVEDVVLFTNLSSDPGVYRAKGTIGDNTITGWDQVSCFRGVDSPIAGDEVFVRAGTVYANTLHTYDGSSWSDTSTDKADTNLGNLTSTSINQDLLPDTTLTRDLGSSSKSWVDVWVERLLAPLGSTIAVATENATSSTNSNNVTVTSGSTVDGTSGQMTAKSGDTSGNGSSNFATFRSGNITGTTSSGNSGITTVRSGNVSGVSSTGDSGNVVVKSGDVSGSGDSGNVAVYSGSSAGGSRGAVNLQGNGILLDSLGQGVDVDNDNIINVADPVNPQDAATKNYTDTLVENPTIEVATFDGQSSTPTNPSAGNYKVYVDDNTQKLTILDSSGNATQIGGGGQGGINYISNYDAEVNTDGWATYADAAGTTPVDGTGGTANITWTRSTSSPLRGDGSFLLTKDAANRQGEGASYNFTIDEADKAKVMQIGFDYAVASGTYATGDVAIYIVDVTNGTVIQPSAYQVENVGVNSTARLTFQTASNSTSYRLCFHVASTSASAYSLKFDNIQLGPQVVPMGAPVTDWVSYTPTVAGLGSAGSTATYPKGWWRRVGDSAQIRIAWASDSVAGSGVSNVSFTSPTGLSMSSSAGIVGSSEAYNGTAFVYNLNVANQMDGTWSPRAQDATTIIVTRAGNAATTITGAALPARQVLITIDLTVPIVGWSSSTVVSSSADTRVVAGSIGKSSAQAITATTYGTAQKVTYNTTPLLDTHGMWDSSNNRWVVKVPGRYRISAPLAYTATTSEVQGIAMLRQNTVDIHQAYLTKSASTNSNVAAVTLEAIVDCKAGDYFEVFTYHPVPAGSLDILANASVSQVRFMIEMLQGPSQIAMSEIIACRAYLSANQTGVNTNNSLVRVNFNATTLDTHGGWNTGTYRYTAPAPGIYEVATTIYTSATNVLANTYHPAIYVNGTEVQYGHPVPSLASTATGGYANWIGQLNAGDYVEIYWYGAGNNSASTMTLFGPSGTKNSSVHIKRLGGV